MTILKGCETTLGVLLLEIPQLESAGLVLSWKEPRQGPPLFQVVKSQPEILERALDAHMEAGILTAMHLARLTGQTREEVLAAAEARLQRVSEEARDATRWRRFLQETYCQDPEIPGPSPAEDHVKEQA